MILGLAAATTAAALASAAGWNSMWPTSQLYGRTFLGVNRGSRLMALTYDDGPNDLCTRPLLEVLAKHDAHATFFMLGRHVARRPEIAREVAAAGHDIGNHTYTHPNLIFASRVQVEAQIDDCEAALNDAVGEHSKLFRPPFGGRRPDVLSIVRRKGLTPVMWAISAYDWNTDPADVITNRIAKQVRGGEVILMHDGGHIHMGTDRKASVAATDQLIRRFKDQGYRFVSVTEMMNTQSLVVGR